MNTCISSRIRRPYLYSKVATGDELKTKAIRLMSAVIIDENDKAFVLADIEAFFDPAAQAWFASRGFPYRRGYLLYGPPGTGKSSLSLAIAGRFSLDLYVVNLSNISEDLLTSLFAELPQRCVVV